VNTPDEHLLSQRADNARACPRSVEGRWALSSNGDRLDLAPAGAEPDSKRSDGDSVRVVDPQAERHEPNWLLARPGNGEPQLLAAEMHIAFPVGTTAAAEASWVQAKRNPGERCRRRCGRALEPNGDADAAASGDVRIRTRDTDHRLLSCEGVGESDNPGLGGGAAAWPIRRTGAGDRVADARCCKSRDDRGQTPGAASPLPSTRLPYQCLGVERRPRRQLRAYLGAID
jgi:hypothetical protein